VFEERTAKIRLELEALKKKVAVQKEKLSKYTKDFIPMEQQFTVNHKFGLDSEEAVYKVTVEAPLNLELVMLQSTKPIRLVDTESNQAIVSLSKPADGNQLLATYRCQEPTNRLEMKLRTVEGQYGDLQVIVIPKMKPATAQTVTLNIKPLSLHHRVSKIRDNRALNTILFAGKFTGRQMHEWISVCLPEVPNRGDDDDGEAQLYFRNAFLTSFLSCKYSNKKAVFKSDSISTIAILKEVITKLATERKIGVRTQFKINPDTVPAFLKLVHPKLEYQLQLKQKADLIEALKEIKMQEDSTSFLDPEYAKIIDNREKILREFKERPKALKSLYGIVTDLYVDMHKFKGIDIARDRNRMLPLMNLLENYTYQGVVNFFVQKPVDHGAAPAAGVSS
jgi:Bardet-Biedl syndrome 7 protein